jgi:hypothetical protein
MCWSAEADLVAGTVITGLGVACLAQVRRLRQVPLALLPLVLGIHQLTEALVWFGEDGRISAGTAHWARTAWAVIALPLLPALVPLGVWCARGPTAPRRTSAALAVVGLTVSALLAVSVVTHPVTAAVHDHTLRYGVGVPYPPVLLTGYLLAAVGALLAGGDRVLRLLGGLVGVGALVCAAVWRLSFVSTWCALAALVSVVLLRWVGQDDVDRGVGAGTPAGPAGR